MLILLGYYSANRALGTASRPAPPLIVVIDGLGTILGTTPRAYESVRLKARS